MVVDYPNFAEKGHGRDLFLDDPLSMDCGISVSRKADEGYQIVQTNQLGNRVESSLGFLSSLFDFWYLRDLDSSLEKTLCQLIARVSGRFVYGKVAIDVGMLGEGVEHEMRFMSMALVISPDSWGG